MRAGYVSYQGMLKEKGTKMRPRVLPLPTTKGQGRTEGVSLASSCEVHIKSVVSGDTRGSRMCIIL